jgi:hypothetical protein
VLDRARGPRLARAGVGNAGPHRGHRTMLPRRPGRAVGVVILDVADPGWGLTVALRGGAWALRTASSLETRAVIDRAVGPLPDGR